MGHPYQIIFRTSNERGSGTNANVFLKFYNPFGVESEEFMFSGAPKLMGPGYRCSGIYKYIDPDCADGIWDPFEKNSIDHFYIEAQRDYGEITEIGLRVEDEYTNDNPAWKLGEIEIITKHIGQDVSWKYWVGKWIGTGKDSYHANDQVNNIRVIRTNPPLS